MGSPADGSVCDRLQHALDQLCQAPAASAAALLEGLAATRVVAGSAAALPALCTLPLAQQAELVLLVRAAPHKFPAGSLAALLRAATPVQEAGSGPLLGASILQHLAAGLGDQRAGALAPPVPPCPDFLLSAAPAFPWAPKLVDAAQLAALASPQAVAAVVPKQQPGLPTPAAGSEARKRPAADGEPAAAGPAPAAAAAAAAAGPAAAKRRRTVSAAASEEEELEGEEAGAQAAVAGRATVAGAVPAALEAPLAGRIAALKQALLESSDAAATGLSPTDQKAVLSAAGAAGTAGALAAAGLDALGDDGVLLVARAAVGPTSAFARCTLVAGEVLLPRLQELDGPPSRALAAATEHLASCNPQALLHACLRPLLAGPPITQHQAELLSRASKDWLPASLLPELLAAACGSGGAAAGGTTGGTDLAVSAAAAPAGVPGANWNEAMVGLVQAILSAKPGLSQATLGALALALQGAAALQPLQASVKFGKLLLTAVKQYSGGLQPYRAQLEAAAALTKSFMTKGVLAAVAKL